MEPDAHLPILLCVDDDEELLAALELVLRRRYRVLCATSGEAGLSILRRRPVDAILSDLALPGMNGLAFLARARRLAPAAPRLLLTGDASSLLDLPEAREAMVHDVLEKPVSAEELVAALEEGRAHAAAGSAAGGPRTPTPVAGFTQTTPR